MFPKIVLSMFLMTVVLFATTQTQKEATAKKYKNERLCKVFQQKIADYQKEMRNDDYAKATLESYKKRAALFCGK